MRRRPRRRADGDRRSRRGIGAARLPGPLPWPGPGQGLGKRSAGPAYGASRALFDSLRIGLQPVISDFRGFVLQAGCVWMRPELPLVYRANYATALLLSGLFGVNTDTQSPSQFLDVLNGGMPKPEYGPPNGGFTMDHPFGIAPRTADDNLAYELWELGASYPFHPVNAQYNAGFMREQAVLMAARQGRISFFGGLPKDNPVISLDSNLVHYRQLHIHGANGSAPEHNKRALEYISTGQVPVKDLITEHIPLERVLGPEVGALYADIHRDHGIEELAPWPFGLAHDLGDRLFLQDADVLLLGEHLNRRLAATYVRVGPSGPCGSSPNTST